MNLPVQFVKVWTTSSELPKWVAFLRRKRREETSRTERWEYYLSKVISLLHNANQVKKSKMKTAEECLIKFVLAGDKNEQPELSPGTRLQRSKMFWGAIVSVPQLAPQLGAEYDRDGMG